ncbi:MAG TPA: S24 family peptidase, partial [Candidatus Polarisedimenticolia bacterium]|nr:S24 family peptidase [Candidatus Polarisedimenticolia bacterium]
LVEIARRCGLSSVATVHRHLALLQERGLLKRRRSRRRGIELRPAARCSPAVTVPLLGLISPDRPIEAHATASTVTLPRELVRRPGETFVLQVKGDALADDQILDGDLLIAERREPRRDGETFVAVQGTGGAVLKVGGRPREAERALGVLTGLLRRYD